MLSTKNNLEQEKKDVLAKKTILEEELRVKHEDLKKTKVCACVCVCVCVCVRAHVCGLACMHAYIGLKMDIFRCMYVCMYVMHLVRVVSFGLYQLYLANMLPAVMCTITK